VTDQCLRSRNCVNVVVAGKQPAPQWLSMDQAIKHCTAGIGIWEWASNDAGSEPDVVMACCGDVPTLETLAAVQLLRPPPARAPDPRDQRRRPDAAAARGGAPHGLSNREFDVLFTTDKPIIFAFHGYPWLIHRSPTGGRTTEPARARLQGGGDDDDALRHGGPERARPLPPGRGRHRPRADASARAAYFKQAIRDKLIDHKHYIEEHGEDMPEITGWRWAEEAQAGARGTSTESDNV